jgi:hypothetical protein
MHDIKGYNSDEHGQSVETILVHFVFANGNGDIAVDTCGVLDDTVSDPELFCEAVLENDLQRVCRRGDDSGVKMIASPQVFYGWSLFLPT